MSPDQEQQAEQLLREANVLRLRKQFAEAEEKCRAALELAPRDLGGIEMLADLVYEKGNLEEARKLYEQALEIQPGPATAETNLARITLELGDREHERAVAQAMFAGASMARPDRKRHVTLSLLLALVGAGQLYNGEWVKGAVVALAVLGGLFVGGDELLRIFLGLLGADTGRQPVSEWKAVIGFVGLSAWVYGLIDAPTRAAQLAEDGKTGADFI